MGSFRSEQGALAFQVRKVWLSMRSAVGEELTAFGLSTSQYATLMMVEDAPGLSNADIGRAVGSSRQAANEMLSGLERDGLIERTPHPADRRTQQLHVTDLGRERLAAARVAVGRREAEIEAAFTQDQRQAVREWLKGVSEACG